MTFALIMPLVNCCSNSATIDEWSLPPIATAYERMARLQISQASEHVLSALHQMLIWHRSEITANVVVLFFFEFYWAGIHILCLGFLYCLCDCCLLHLPNKLNQFHNNLWKQITHPPFLQSLQSSRCMINELSQRALQLGNLLLMNFDHPCECVVEIFHDLEPDEANVRCVVHDLGHPLICFLNFQCLKQQTNSQLLNGSN